MTKPGSTPEGAAPSFQSAWAELSPALCDVLARDGVPKPLAEDIVQETGIRMLTRWADVDSDRPLMPLAVTIARRLVVDHHRKYDRLELQAFPQQDRAPVDVEQRALARVHLGAVYRSLHKINPRYRRLLLAEAGYLADGAEARDPAARTARARARSGLTQLVERMPDAAWVFVAPVVGLRRRWSSRVRQIAGRGEWVTVSHAVAGLGLFLASLSSPGLPPGQQHHVSPPPLASVGEGSPTSSQVDPGSPASGFARSDLSADDGGVAPETRSGDRARSDGPSSSLLPPAAHSHGAGSASGYSGLDRLDESGSGSGTVAGEPVEWDYRVRYRHPGCVGSAVAGDPTLNCEPTPEARARGSLRYGQHEGAVDTSEGGS